MSFAGPRGFGSGAAGALRLRERPSIVAIGQAAPVHSTTVPLGTRERRSPVQSNPGVRNAPLAAMRESTMSPEVAWWERFWKGAALAITVAAVFVEGVLPMIRYAIERL
jgi:hypothetical protein